MRKREMCIKNVTAKERRRFGITLAVTFLRLSTQERETFFCKKNLFIIDKNCHSSKVLTERDDLLQILQENNVPNPSSGTPGLIIQVWVMSVTLSHSNKLPQVMYRRYNELLKIRTFLYSVMSRLWPYVRTFGN